MREVPVSPDILAGLAAGPVDPPDPVLVARVREAVDRLPEPERSVVEMLVWGRMSKVEVAETLGLSRSHVHNVWLRALEALYGWLADL